MSGQPLPGLPDDVFGERIVRCGVFLLDRYDANGPFEVAPGNTSIWLVVDGDALLASADGGYLRTFRRGETVLIPASAEGLSWSPRGEGRPATLLASTL